MLCESAVSPVFLCLCAGSCITGYDDNFEGQKRCNMLAVFSLVLSVSGWLSCQVGSIRDIITHGDIMSYIIYIQCHSDHGLVRLIE